jgi:quinol monooxygenase YgiN
LQHNTELLVVTLVYTIPDRDADAQAYIHLIGEMMHNATGLVTSSFYRSREQQHYYFLLTIWEDEESWQQAQERYNPKALLLARPDLLTTRPEQWSTHYCWGYSRPASQQMLSTSHIAMVSADELEAKRVVWLQELRKQAAQFTFAFSFLAYGTADTSTENSTANILIETANTARLAANNVLLTFISWPSDTERVKFYSTEAYRQMSATLEQDNDTYMLLLDPL